MTASVLLLLAIGALLLGPVAYRFTENSTKLAALVDGFAITSVGGLALLHLGPEALEHGGPIAAVCLILGFALPTWLHKVGDLGALSDKVLMAAVMSHTALETAALGTASPENVSALGFAIVGHQLPVGLAVFSVTSTRREGYWMLALLVAGMVGGFLTGQASATLVGPQQNAWLTALAAGSLLHVLGEHKYDHQPAVVRRDPRHRLGTLEGEIAPPAQRVSSGGGGHAHGGHAHGGHAHGGHAHGGHAHGTASSHQPTQPGASLIRQLFSSSPTSRTGTLGAALGIALLLGQLRAHGHGETEGSSLLATLSELLLDSAPALVIGFSLAGLLPLLLGHFSSTLLTAGSSWSQALRGIAFGLPLPICSCGVLPVYESLVRRGTPLAAASAFLVATPELGVDAALLSWPLLGGRLALFRLGAAFLVALGTGLIISRSQGTHAERRPSQSVPSTAERTTLAEALAFGWGELLDHTLPWIGLGIVLAALCMPIFQAVAATHLPGVVEVPLYAFVGLPLYVCASGATPLAAIAISQGASPGAALAFLLSGPATNVTTFAVLARLHGRRTAFVFGAAVFVLAVLAGFAVNALVSGAPPPMPPTHSDGWLFLRGAAVLALAILTLGSLLRQGPRGMLLQIMNPMR